MTVRITRREFACALAATSISLMVPRLGRSTDPPDALPEPIQEHLKRDPFIYVSSTRKSGSLSEPTEVRCIYEEKAIFVTSDVWAHRVRRLKAGRPKVRIWVSSIDGPWIDAEGELVENKEVRERVLQGFARKYPQEWPAWDDRMRSELAEGRRAMIRYKPSGKLGIGPGGLPEPSTPH